MIISKEIRARKIRVDTGWPSITTHYATEIDCQMPKDTFVDIIDIGPYDQEYRIQVPVSYYKEGPKKTIAVCVKPVTGKLEVSKLVEWFEMFRLVGIEDFIIYDADVIGNTKFVFDFYVRLGILDLIAFPFIMALLDHVDGPHMRPVDRYGVYQQSFLVAMQDCFYRYQHHFEYLLFVDLDEILVPSSDISVQHLAHLVHEKYPDAAAFMFLTAWHFEEINVQKQKDSELQTADQYRKYSKVTALLRHSNTGARFWSQGSESRSSIKDLTLLQEGKTVPHRKPTTYMQKHSYATIPLDIQPKSIVYPPHTVTVNFHGAHDVPDIKHGNVRIIDYDKYGYIHHFRGTCLSKFDERACEKLQAKARLDEAVVRYRDRVANRVEEMLGILQMK